MAQTVSSHNYALAAVPLAAALFFAGMTTKLQRPALRRTVVWLATFPMSVAV